jgi:hypothetical protein
MGSTQTLSNYKWSYFRFSYESYESIIVIVLNWDVTRRTKHVSSAMFWMLPRSEIISHKLLLKHETENDKCQIFEQSWHNNFIVNFMVECIDK